MNMVTRMKGSLLPAGSQSTTTIRSRRLRLGFAIGLLIMSSCLAACSSFASTMNSWIGKPIEPYLAIQDRGGETLDEIRGPDERGHKIYVFTVEKNCRVFWDVDAQGIVTGWKSEGWACKHYWQ